MTGNVTVKKPVVLRQILILPVHISDTAGCVCC